MCVAGVWLGLVSNVSAGTIVPSVIVPPVGNVIVNPLCGNGVLDSGEQCDGTNLRGKTCASFRLLGGTLTCTNCQYDTSGCYRCGNGVVDPGEECDGTAGLSNPALVTCSATCVEVCKTGVTQACQNSNAFGTCSGQQTCSNGVWSACSAATPSTETCDGTDNDCDGTIDDGFDVGTTCTVGSGGCGGSGATVCGADGTSTVCNAAFSPDGARCNDLNACTGGDQCVAGACQGGALLNANDGIACTVDTCDTQLGVVHTPRDSACDDGNACTADSCSTSSGCGHVTRADGYDLGGGQICWGGVARQRECTPGSTRTCGDGTTCGSGQQTCQADYTWGGCQVPAEGTTCDDGNACTGGDQCQGRLCLAGPTLDSNDSNKCTTDSCDPVLGVQHTPVSSDDGNACTVDSCDTRFGVQHTPVATDDTIACTVDSCDPQLGVQHTPTDSACDDSNACTVDSCSTSSGCRHVTQADGYDLGGGQICWGGVARQRECTPGSTRPCGDGTTCGSGQQTCQADFTWGGCQVPAEGTTCDDGNACTSGDQCQGRSCIATATVNPDDNDKCTTDACDALLGIQHTPVDVGDGNACTVDSCDPRIGELHTPVSTGDGDACTVDTCDTRFGVQHTPVSSDDNDKCTIDSCDTRLGVQHTPVTTDDSIACTVDSCDPQLGVQHTPTDSACDDSNACTVDSCSPSLGCRNVVQADGYDLGGGQICWGGVARQRECTPGATRPCGDGTTCGGGQQTCQADYTWGGCQVPAEGTTCDDGNACTSGDQCQGRLCVAGPTLDANDSNKCTTDSCDPQLGIQHTPVSSDDGNACTVDSCDARFGIQHTPVTTDDSIACTVDSCDPQLGVQHTPTDSACDDSNACTVDSCSTSSGCGHVTRADGYDLGGGQICWGGVARQRECTPGATRPCGDGTTCGGGQQTCQADFTWGGCQVPAEGTTCDDGNACTSGDQCQGRLCVAGPTLDANDSNKCTTDSCDPQLGIQHTPVSSDDGNACTVDSCDARFGIQHTPVTTDDSIACTVDSCDPQLGVQHAPTDSACNDSNACTVDSCSTSSGCGHVTRADGYDLGGGQICWGGVARQRECTPGSTRTCGDGTTCGSGQQTCQADFTWGGCQVPAEGTTCDDGNACTSGDQCLGRLCVAGPTLDANDSNKCTTDSCDPQLGIQHTPVSSDDGNACTVDSCDTRFGVQHTPVATDDSIACTVDSCDPQLGVQHAPTDSACDDSNACTVDSCSTSSGCGHVTRADGYDLGGGQICWGGVARQRECTPGSTRTCGDGTTCGSGQQTCQADFTWGGCQVPAEGTTCDDGNACTSGDQCQGRSCIATATVNPDDNDKCSADSCDPQLGVQHTPVDVSDGNACTVDSCDPRIGELHTPVSTGDGDACTVDTCDTQLGVQHAPVSSDDNDKCTIDSCDTRFGVQHAPVPTDDSIACTVDSCDPQLGVQHVPTDSACDDSNACTADSCSTSSGCRHVTQADGYDLGGGQICWGGVARQRECTPGSTRTCGDGTTCGSGQQTCQVDFTWGGCQVPAEGTTCDDGNACTSGDQCQGRLCVAGPTLDANDSNKCTTDSCDPQLGIQHTPVSSDDGNACTVDSCDTRFGVQHTPVATDDTIACTVDSCDPQLGVQHVPTDSACDDDNVCTVDSCSTSSGCGHVTRADGYDLGGGQICWGGVARQRECTPGSTRTCGDGTTCGSGQQTCQADFTWGGCQVPAEGTTCDDGNACTSGDQCQGRLCVAGPTIDSNDSNKCTTDSCDPLLGVQHTPVSSDDNDKCTIDSCDTRFGVQHTPVTTDDSIACTVDSCDPQLGVQHAPTDSACDDSNACTVDSCSTSSGCGHVTRADGYDLGGGQICWGGVARQRECTPGATRPCGDGTTCGSGQQTCQADLTWGGCQVPAAGTPCDDGNACTSGDQCQGRLCVAGPTLDANDSNKCTTDSCDPLLGVQHTPVSSDDNDKCTIDSCDTRLGVQHTPVATDDSIACTVDSCDPQLGVQHAPTDSACDDSNACTVDSCSTNSGCRNITRTDGYDLGGGQICWGGVARQRECTPGSTRTCGDGTTCGSGQQTCQADFTWGGCQVPAEGTTCDDGNACTSGDQCQGRSCIATATVNPDDDDKCTTDACDALLGIQHTLVDVGDGNACTVDSCDPRIGEQHTPVTTGDGDACTVDTCDPQLGIQHTPVSSDDNDKCTIDSCDTRFGVQHAPVPTDDSIACTVDSCDPRLGVQHVPTDSACDDSNACTVDSCSPSLGCRNITRADGYDLGGGQICWGGVARQRECTPGSTRTCGDGTTCGSGQQTCQADFTWAGCQVPAEGTTCDDGNACTSGDQCQGRLCVATATINPDDNDKCTTDACDAQLGVQHTPVDVSDGNACTVDSCDPRIGEQHAPVTMGDGDACTVDSCDPQLGIQHTPVSSDDGNACTVDSCDARFGIQHTPVATDDSIACTVDSCDPQLGVQHTPTDSACDDSNACTVDSCSPSLGCRNITRADGYDLGGGQICWGGVVRQRECTPGSTRTCGDGTTCGSGQQTCQADSTWGGCQVPAEGTTCDDGNACTSGDQCQGRLCVAGPTLDANDSNKCTTDSCDPQLGIQHVPVSSDDNDKCTIDSCDTRFGVQHTPVTTDDSIACTVDSCDPQLGVQHVPTDSACDDSNACTVDSCSTSSGCRHVTRADGYDLGGGQICWGGVARQRECAPGATRTCGDGTTCGSGQQTCQADLTWGGCQVPAAGTPCDDGNACTSGDQCQGRLCVAGPTLDANDSNKCTTDSCDPQLGIQHVPVSSDDNDKCTIDSCDTRFGVQHTPVTTDDSIACTVDSCDPQLGVQHAPTDSACDDSNACTVDSCSTSSGCGHVTRADGYDLGGGQICWGGVARQRECTPGATRPCGDGTTCGSGQQTCQVDFTWGGCQVPAEGTTCDDGNACTSGDQCQGRACVAGPTLDATDSNNCTTDSCDPLLGVQHAPVSSDDNDKCTIDSCDTRFGVQHVPVSTDDTIACTVDTCDPQLGVQHAPTDSACDDSNACTVDACSTSSGCGHVTRADGYDLGGGQICWGGVARQRECTPGSTRTCGDGTTCGSGQQTCQADFTWGGCQVPATGTPCNDGNACTSGDQCQGRACVAGPTLDANDNNQCTTDSCDPTTGLRHAPVNTDDGNACTADTCDAQLGVQHTSTRPPAPTACQQSGTAQCNPATGEWTYAVRDTDHDGTADCDDACAQDPLKTAPGTCGCGQPETDRDGDGIADCQDNCPAVANADQADANANQIGNACDQWCGNDVREAAEACDGADLAGATCAQALDHPGALGTPSCTSACELDLTACHIPECQPTDAIQSCVIASALGVCRDGEKTCTANGAWSACKTIQQPTAEACDGQDNDCDGQVDEGVVQTYYRDQDQDGFGTLTEFINACQPSDGYTTQIADCDDVHTTVHPGATEACNGIDDDCDGQIDEELPMQQAYNAATGQPGVGSCRAQESACVQGTWTVLPGKAMVTPQAESCDGLDNDCNGTVDDGVPGAPCYTGPAGTQDVGLCHGGAMICQAGSWGSCANEVLPGAEICGNAIDEDCDGQDAHCVTEVNPPPSDKKAAQTVWAPQRCTSTLFECQGQGVYLTTMTTIEAVARVPQSADLLVAGRSGEQLALAKLRLPSGAAGGVAGAASPTSQPCTTVPSLAARHVAASGTSRLLLATDSDYYVADLAPFSTTAAECTVPLTMLTPVPPGLAVSGCAAGGRIRAVWGAQDLNGDTQPDLIGVRTCGLQPSDATSNAPTWGLDLFLSTPQGFQAQTVPLAAALGAVDAQPPRIVAVGAQRFVVTQADRLVRCELAAAGAPPSCTTETVPVAQRPQAGLQWVATEHAVGPTPTATPSSVTRAWLTQPGDFCRPNVADPICVAPPPETEALTTATVGRFVARETVAAPSSIDVAYGTAAGVRIGQFVTDDATPAPGAAGPALGGSAAMPWRLRASTEEWLAPVAHQMTWDLVPPDGAHFVTSPAVMATELNGYGGEDLLVGTSVVNDAGEPLGAAINWYLNRNEPPTVALTVDGPVSFAAGVVPWEWPLHVIVHDPTDDVVTVSWSVTDAAGQEHAGWLTHVNPTEARLRIVAAETPPISRGLEIIATAYAAPDLSTVSWPLTVKVIGCDPGAACRTAQATIVEPGTPQDATPEPEEIDPTPVDTVPPTSAPGSVETPAGAADTARAAGATEAPVSPPTATETTSETAQESPQPRGVAVEQPPVTNEEPLSFAKWGVSGGGCSLLVSPPASTADHPPADAAETVATASPSPSPTALPPDENGPTCRSQRFDCEQARGALLPEATRAYSLLISRARRLFLAVTESPDDRPQLTAIPWEALTRDAPIHPIACPWNLPASLRGVVQGPDTPPIFYTDVGYFLLDESRFFASGSGEDANCSMAFKAVAPTRTCPHTPTLRRVIADDDLNGDGIPEIIGLGFCAVGAGLDAPGAVWLDLLWSQPNGWQPREYASVAQATAEQFRRAPQLLVEHALDGPRIRIEWQTPSSAVRTASTPRTTTDAKATATESAGLHCRLEREHATQTAKAVVCEPLIDGAVSGAALQWPGMPATHASLVARSDGTLCRGESGTPWQCGSRALSEPVIGVTAAVFQSAVDAAGDRELLFRTRDVLYPARLPPESVQPELWPGEQLVGAAPRDGMIRSAATHFAMPQAPVTVDLDGVGGAEVCALFSRIQNEAPDGVALICHFARRPPAPSPPPWLSMTPPHNPGS